MSNTTVIKEGDTEYEIRTVGNKSRNWFYRHTIGAAKAAGPGKSILFTVVFILFVIYALFLIIPFVWILINSFKGAADFADDKWALNFSAGFSNYVQAFNYKVKGTTVLGMYLNSFLVVGGGVVVTLISCTLASYTMAKYKFKGRAIIYNLVIISMMIPIVGTLPAQYRLMQTLGLKNIVGVWFLYSGGFGFNFLFLYSYFKSISWTYAEAAQIDGASDFRIFIQIMVPMARPALTAVGVLTFMGLWCDYQTPYLYLNNMPTIALGLKDMSEQLSTMPSNTTLVLATAILATIPILILFCVFQKTIMNNMTVGGLKG